MLKQIRNWRKFNKIPSQVLLCDNDNELFLDLEVVLYLEMLWSTVKNRQFFKLEEFLFNPEKPLVSSSNGWYTNEIILLFKKENNGKVE